MANIQPPSLRLNAGSTLLILAVLACNTLSACSSAEKATTKELPEAPQATNYKSKDTDTDTGTGASGSIDEGRQVDAHPPVDANNTTVDMGGQSPAVSSGNSDSDKVHVDLPGVKVDVNQSGEKVDIKAPFVHIRKDGQGNTQIKAPFVRINTKDGDSR